MNASVDTVTAPQRAVDVEPSGPTTARRRPLTVDATAIFWVTIALLLAGGVARWMTPQVSTERLSRPFEQTIPRAFGDWKAVDSAYSQVDPTITRSGETSLNQPYDDILMRVYQNSLGEIVMLSLAYGRQQRQEVKIHRPDLCYVAQGFRVTSLAPATMSLDPATGQSVQGKRMTAVRETRANGYTELVSYWIRVGSMYSENAWTTRSHIFQEGLAGRVPDGVLVRASRIADDTVEPGTVHAALESFLAELVAATPAEARRLLVR